MKKFILLIFFLISLSFLSHSVISADEEQLKSYEKNIFVTYQVLLGVFGMVVLVTAMMVAQHYGFKHLFKAIVGVTIGFLILIFIRIWG